MRNTIPWKIDCESTISRKETLTFLQNGFSVDNNSKALVIWSSCFLGLHVITTIFVLLTIEKEGSSKKQIAFIMIVLREVLLILLCIFSFKLLRDMNGDVDESSSRLDWADRARGCTDSYSDVNTQLYRYQLNKASSYIKEGIGCAIAVAVALGLHLIALLYMVIKCYKDDKIHSKNYYNLN